MACFGWVVMILVAGATSALAAATFTVSRTVVTVGQTINIRSVTPCPAPSGAGDWTAIIKFGQGTNPEVSYEDYTVGSTGSWGGPFTVPTAAMIGTAQLAGSCFDAFGTVDTEVNYQAVNVRVVWPTKVTVSCTPQKVRVKHSTVCAATVTTPNAGAKAATGTVHFATSAPGHFSRPSCALVAGSGSASSCHVRFTPTAGRRSDPVSVRYGGDAIHAAGGASTKVRVTR